MKRPCEDARPVGCLLGIDDAQKVLGVQKTYRGTSGYRIHIHGFQVVYELLGAEETQIYRYKNLLMFLQQQTKFGRPTESLQGIQYRHRRSSGCGRPVEGLQFKNVESMKKIHGRAYRPIGGLLGIDNQQKVFGVKKTYRGPSGYGRPIESLLRAEERYIYIYRNIFKFLQQYGAYRRPSGYRRPSRFRRPTEGLRGIENILKILWVQQTCRRPPKHKKHIKDPP